MGFTNQTKIWSSLHYTYATNFGHFLYKARTHQNAFSFHQSITRKTFQYSKTSNSWLYKFQNPKTIGRNITCMWNLCYVINFTISFSHNATTWRNFLNPWNRNGPHVHKNKSYILLIQPKTFKMPISYGQNQQKTYVRRLSRCGHMTTRYL